MAQVCPTITAYDIVSFQAQLALVSDFSDRIHIDLMDGDFAPTTSPKLHELNLPMGKQYDIHIMYRNPTILLDELLTLRPHCVIIHAESNSDVPLFASQLRQKGLKTGLALLPETTVIDTALLLPHVQHILIFGGKLGYHGGTADLTQLSKVGQVKALTRYAEIGWDGGADTTNIPEIKNAGVDIINIGGCIHGASDPQARYQELQKLASG